MECFFKTNGSEIVYQIDTGAEVNVISKAQHSRGSPNYQTRISNLQHIITQRYQ